MTKTGHLSVQKGKRVLVHLKDGGKVIKRFEERKGRYLHFDDGSRISTDRVRTVSVWKGPDSGGVITRVRPPASREALAHPGIDICWGIDGSVEVTLPGEQEFSRRLIRDGNAHTWVKVGPPPEASST